MESNKPKRNLVPIILGAVLLVGGFFGGKKILYMMNNEDTENSQLESNIYPITPKVGGYIIKLNIKDNQRVKKGDTLAMIDDRDLRIRVKQAEIALKNAEVNASLVRANVGSVAKSVDISRANVETAGASIESIATGIETAKANIEAAKVRVWKANEEYKRYATLVSQQSATQQQLDAAKAEKETAEALLNASQKQMSGVEKSVAVAQRQSGGSKAQELSSKMQFQAAQKQIPVADVQIEQRRSELEYARLQQSYAYVLAPCDGVISKKAVQEGQLVNMGSSLCLVVDDSNVWVTANFKETQVARMVIGQKVKIKIDAYEKKEFEGTIESIAPATGARFALLPPDNASGNFVKVVQRIPVKIIITDKNEEKLPLRAGMSVGVVAPVK